MTLLAGPDLALPLLPVVGSDMRVPLVGGGEARVVDLDIAATAPALAAVAEHVTAVLPHLGSVHRGAGWRSTLATAGVEQARSTVAGFLGARPADAVVFTRNTTEALNLLASAVPGSCWSSTSSTTPTCCPGTVRPAAHGAARGGHARSDARADRGGPRRPLRPRCSPSPGPRT